MSETTPVLQRLRDGLRSIGETIAAYLDGDLAAERAAVATSALEGPAEDVDAGPWIVAARVEGDEARHLAGGPLTAARLEATADSYDPAYRRAPVLLSHNEGSAPVVGYVEELDFDGLNLMARVSEIEPNEDGTGRLTRAVADGWRQRSVKIALREPGLEGNPPYLYHLALLSAQQPGTPDLPHLDSTFLRSDSETETVTRAILDDVEPTATQEDEMTQEDLTRAVTDAVAPLASRIDQLQTELAATRSQLDEARAASDTATADARRAALESTVTELVTAGRVSPAEQELELEALLALPEDKAALRVAAIRNRPAFLVRRGATRLTAAVETLPTMAQRVAEVGDVPVRMDPEALRVLAEAERDAAGDEAKLRELIYRAHGEPCPATARA